MKLLNRITDIYLIYVLLFFILLIDKSGYSNILVFKWNMYVYVSIVYILTILIISAIKILNKSISIKEFSFNQAYLFALIYLFIMIVSTIFSPYKSYNLLIGSPRMQGLIVNIIYIVSFIVVSLTYKFNKNTIYVVLLPSIIMGFIIILQKIGYNPFYLYKKGYSKIFCGTIGNVDTVGLLYTMYIVLSLSLFIFSKSFNKIYLIISVIISLIVMMIIDVTSMYVSLFIIMLLVFPYATLKSTYLFRYLVILLCILIVVLIYQLDKYFMLLSIIFMVILTMLILRNKTYNIVCKKNIKLSYYLLVVFILLLIFGIYIVDFKSGFIYELHSIMHGNLDDSFGTYRMFLIKRTIRMLDINHILLGSGVDTFYIPFMNKYFSDLQLQGYVNINDSACNFYLTMLINVGILGLSSFMLFIYKIFKLAKSNINALSVCLLITILSYLIQGLFNIEVVIVTPIFYVMLSIYINSLKSIEK